MLLKELLISLSLLTIGLSYLIFEFLLVLSKIAYIG